MTMTDYKKYDKLINILRNSKPRLDNTVEVEREVINAITGKQRSAFSMADFLEFLFGWASISWVRRSLVTLSVLLVVAFVWQQSIILRQIKYLSRQAIYISNANIPGTDDILEKKLLIYKLSGKIYASGTITLSEEQLNQLFESVNDMSIRYKDLMNIIEENPDIRKFVEKKLSERDHIKIKL